MRRNVLLCLSAFIVFYSCRKVGSAKISSAEVNAGVIEFTDTVKIPLTDFKKRTYFGFTGGLYPGGVNKPTGQYATNLMKFVSAVYPRNARGEIDSVAGQICFISIGGSTGGHMMDSLKQKTFRDANTNPYLKLINCNNGASTSSLNSISNPNDPYWDHVKRVLFGAHAYNNQVEVIYLETEDSTSVQSFPDRPYIFRDNLEAVMRTCKLKFKYLKLMYVLGRTTTFNVHAIQNEEPAPYYNGWGAKFAIEDQINGKPGTEYTGRNAVAPLLTWGWYQWADGSNIPRKDGFTWLESETEDGLHATPAGEDTLATRFQNFLLTDHYASVWYVNHASK